MYCTRALATAFLALLLVAITGAARAAAPAWTEKVVVTSRFGAAPDQFGRAGLEASTKTVRLITCFAASTKYIAVHDRLKRDVKIFASTGAFDKAIRLAITAGARPDTIRARDLALDGDALYVFVDEGDAKTLPATMRIATFDVASGAFKNVRPIETARLSATPTARGADAFLLHANDSRLWLVDTIRQLSFEIVAGSPYLGERPAFGWGGTHRVRTDDNTSSINLLDASGKTTRRIPESGVLTAVSPDGDAIAVLQAGGGADWTIAVFNAQGDRIASAPRPNRSWKPFKAPVMERKYELVETPNGAELYEIFANAEGVRVVRWSK